MPPVATPDACLTEDAAIAYVHGRLEGAPLEAAKAHLSHCRDCTRTLESVGLARTVSQRRRTGTPEPAVRMDGAQSGPALADTQPSSRPGSVTLPRGTSIGRYVLLRRLGEGGMGVVYAAYDPELDRKVAIKLLRDDVQDPARAEAYRGRLFREAQALARLSHPNVIVVHDVGTFGTQVFMAMEFVEGQTAGRWLREGKRTWREVLEMFRFAGRGLAAAHAAGLIHRDFKPDNVILAKDGRVRVMDFGLARSTDDDPSISGARALFTSTTDLRKNDVLGEPLTEAGMFLGTPGYMAPEQHHGGEVDARTDQFSFCVALYEALYGERPFAGQTVDALGLAVGQGMIKEPPKDSDVPGWLRKLLLRGMAVKPDDRFPSMDELLAALSRRRGRFTKRQLTLLAAAAVAGLCLAFVFSQSARVKICQTTEGDALALFGPAAHTQLAAAFMATGATQWEGDFARTAKVLERHLAELGAQRDAACEALRSPSASSRRLAQRMRCIDRGAELAAAVINQLGNADALAVERSIDAAYSLPSPKECGDLEARRAPPWPEDAPGARDAKRLSEQLARARALELLGRSEEALAVARAALATAEAQANEPLKAEALLRVGELQGRLELRESAQSTLYEALWSAEAARHDAVVAAAWVALVDVVGLRRGFDEQGLQSVRHAEAAIRRLGGAPDLEVRLGEAHARLLERRGLHAEALVVRQAALQRAQSAIGVEHPATGEALNGVASSMEALERWADAASYRQRAVELLQQLRGEQHPSLRDPLFALGKDLLFALQPPRAVAPLERALALGEKTLAAAELSELRFALAQALWGATLDKDRARRLALLARDGRPKAPAGTDEGLTKIESWIAAHDAP